MKLEVHDGVAFDSNPYNIKKIKEVLNKFPSISNIRTQYHYGSNNQQRVVTFTLDISIGIYTPDIEYALEQELGIRNIIVCNPCKWS